MRLTHPSVTFALVWLVLIGLDFTRRHWSGSTPVLPRGTVRLVAQIVLLAYGVIVVWYACQLAYFDRAEPTITAVASIFAAGKPLYPALDAPERYAHIYGPALFIAHASTMAVLGQSILVSKAVGALAILASLLVAYRVFVGLAGEFAAFAASAACAAVYLDFGDATFWTRPDPLVILCVVLGLYAARLGRIGSLVVLGVATGLAVNLKVSGPVYLLPAFVLVGSRHGRSSLMGAVGLATLVGVAPFLIPNVSLAHYWQYIELSARNGLIASKLRQNVEWAIVLAAPLVSVTYARRRGPAPGPRHEGAFLASVGVSLVVIAVIAAKRGGGPFHLLPCVPLLAYAVLRAPVRVWERRWTTRAVAVAFGLTALIIAVPRQVTLVRTVFDRHASAVVDDLRRFADAHPSSRIDVGYAGLSYFSDARPEMVFRTHEYLLDAPAVQEYRLSGLDLPASTMRAIDDCLVAYWLLPSGADPFVVPSAYWPDGPKEVFPEEFRRAFFRRYKRTTRTQYFDVWECQK